MHQIRQNIFEGTFVNFVRTFMKTMFADENYPEWVVDALSSVNITLHPTPKGQNDTTEQNSVTELN